jgi:hypothetical protein
MRSVLFHLPIHPRVDINTPLSIYYSMYVCKHNCRWMVDLEIIPRWGTSILSVHFALWRRMHLSKHVCKSRKVLIRTDISNPCGLRNGIEQGLHSTSLNSEEEPVRWSPLFFFFAASLLIGIISATVPISMCMCMHARTAFTRIQKNARCTRRRGDSGTSRVSPWTLMMMPFITITSL